MTATTHMVEFRMYQALQLKQPEEVCITNERTVYWVMEEIGLAMDTNMKATLCEHP